MALDMGALQKELVDLAHVIEPIAIPSKETWEGMLVEHSLNVTFKNERLYWAYYAYFGSENFRAAVHDYNTEVRFSGLVELAQGKAPERNSPASSVLRAIENKQPSSALLDSWFHFGVLLGRQYELLEANGDHKGLFQRDLKAGAASAAIGQQVWYARWLVKNAKTLARDREGVQSELADLCEDIFYERRKLPAAWIWRADWFERLLPRSKDEWQAGQLASGFTRLRSKTVLTLAAHRCITDDMLPPLVMSKFPRTADDP